MPRLSVAGLQLENGPCSSVQDLRFRIDAACSLIESNPGHQVYLLPELSPQGYSEASFRHLRALSADAERLCTDAFSEIAARAKCFICFGFAAPAAAGRSSLVIGNSSFPDSLPSLVQKIDF